MLQKNEESVRTVSYSVGRTPTTTATGITTKVVSTNQIIQPPINNKLHIVVGGLKIIIWLSLWAS